MFPKLDRDIIETVYTSNGCDTELSIGILLEMSGESHVLFEFISRQRPEPVTALSRYKALKNMLENYKKMN